MSASVLVPDGAESDLRSTHPPRPAHRNLIVRPALSALAALRVVLCLLTALGMSACAAETSSSVTAGPTLTRCQVSVSTPATIESVGGSTVLTVTTQPECVWNASTSMTWITGLTPASGQGSGRVELRVSANPNPAVREGDVIVNDGRARVVQAAAPVSCRYDITPVTQTLDASGGEAVVNVGAAAGCTWTVTVSGTWLVASSPTSGSGNGRVTFTAAPNTGRNRTAIVTIGGQAVTVEQSGVAGPPPPCSYALSAIGQSIGASGGAGNPVTVTTASGCAWTAASTVPWITITGGASGTGTGTVTFSVAANTGAARTGSVTIADQTLVVTQAELPPPQCTFGIAPQSQSIVAAGGTVGPITVTATSGCGWTTVSNAAWITIASGANGIGNGSVTLTVAANTGAARTGTVVIAGQTFQVSQAPAPTVQCSYTITPTSQTIPSAATTGSPIAVTTAAGCAWTATSGAPWLTITAGASGSGNGSVSFTALANPGAARTGTLTVAGETFSVFQSAAVVCSYSLNPTSASLAAAAGAGPAIAVTTTSTCAWTATANQSWITITSGASGTGNGSVGFSVSANTGGSRTGTITIGGQTFQVNQAAACTFTLSPTSATYGINRADGNNITITTTAGCAWTAVSNVAWMSISANPSGTGSGNTRYDVSRNTSGSTRIGTLTVAGQTFQVTQTAN